MSLCSHNVNRCEHKNMKYTELQNILIKELGRNITQAEIAEVLHLERSSISMRIKRNSDVSENHKKRIEDYFGVKLESNQLGEFISDNKFLDAKFFPDVIGSCGRGVFEQSQNFELVKIPKYLLSAHNQKKEYSVITAKGNSMSGAIEDGDKLLIESFENEQIIDNEIYVFCYKQELFIKRLCKNINQIIIKSDNKDFPTRYIEDDDINNIYIIGKVVALVRNYF